MQYATLGNAGLFVSCIALGAMTFAGQGHPLWETVGALDLKAADELVGIALDAGVNLIDTADVYAGGGSEELLGQILGSRRDDVVLATKLSARVGPGPNDAGASRLHLTKALNASLRRLRTDHVDLYQIHGFDPLTPIDSAARRATVNWPPAEQDAAYDVIDVLKAIAERHGASVAQVAIAWVLAQPGVTSAIVGARRPAQLIDNLGSLDVALTPADLGDLDAASAPPVAYPAWLQAEVAPGRLPQQPATS